MIDNNHNVSDCFLVLVRGGLIDSRSGIIEDKR